MNFIFTGIALLVSLAVVLLALKSRHHKRLPFPKSFIFSPAIVNTPLIPHGSILISGELWLARSENEQELASQTKVIVVGTQDHLLLVAQR